MFYFLQLEKRGDFLNLFIRIEHEILRGNSFLGGGYIQSYYNGLEWNTIYR